MTRLFLPSLPVFPAPVFLFPSCSSRTSGCWQPSVISATKHLFHTSGRLLNDNASSTGSQTHYETLNVPLHAPLSEIKKSFYNLSKVHHPDHNPQDPHAPRRFMRISEAYAVLGHSDKRAAYDRDILRHHPHLHRMRYGHPVAGHRPNSSYHSTGPAGGRPASGLSRRRGSFKGPPPSFFRNTGTGEAAPMSSGSGGGGGHSPGARPAGHPGFGTGAGPGNVNPDDFGTRARPDTPHFDHAANERTQRRLDERWARRRAAEEAAKGIAVEPGGSMLFGFLVICAALTAGVLVPIMALGEWRRKKREPAKLR